MEIGKSVWKKAISINSLILLFILTCFMQDQSSVPRDGALAVSEQILDSFAHLDPARFEEGDLILRRGSSTVSGFIARGLPGSCEMSHCGILTAHGDSWQVVHSISGKISDLDGIRIDSLQDFLRQAQPGKAIHIKPRFSIDRHAISENAHKYLRRRIPFDHDFDLEDSNRMYCSELIRQVYLDSGADDVFSYYQVGLRRLVSFAAFFDGQYWQSSP